jgi:hypothetical protein
MSKALQIITRKAETLDVAQFISEMIPGEKGDAAVSKFAGRDELKRVFQMLLVINQMQKLS